MTDSMPTDPEFLTVRELAGLLRLKERKIYDLAATGAVPCSRATGKLLFPAAEVRAWIGRATSGGRAAPAAVRAPRPAIVLGSHDPLLDWAIRQSRSGLATWVDGSHDGLARFARAEGVAAGLHLRDPATGTWNVEAARQAAKGQDAVLIAFAGRRRGLAFRPDAAPIAGVSDLAGRRIAPRQKGSGSDGLFRDLLAGEGVDPAAIAWSEVARTEDEAVDAVRRGDADAAFGLEASARTCGLSFRPLIEEEFALLVDRRAFFDPPIQSLLEFCATDAFRTRAATFGGYDVTDFGRVLWNG